MKKAYREFQELMQKELPLPAPVVEPTVLTLEQIANNLTDAARDAFQFASNDKVIYHRLDERQVCCTWWDNKTCQKCHCGLFIYDKRRKEVL